MVDTLMEKGCPDHQIQTCSDTVHMLNFGHGQFMCLFRYRIWYILYHSEFQHFLILSI